MPYKFKLTPQVVPLKKTQYVSIQTPIPSQESCDIIDKSLQYEPESMNDQLPVVWDRAKGFQVWDTVGNCWIDFTSTIFVANVGHSNEKVKQAIIDTASKDLLNSYYYATKERATFAENLIGLGLYGKKVLFLTTGSEATEAAIKLAMLHGKRSTRPKKYILTFENSFHGKTMGAQMAGGKSKEKEWVKWQHPDIINIPYPYPWVLKELNLNGAEFFKKTIKELREKHQLCRDDIAAFMLEPYQGWCAIFPPQDYMNALVEYCKYIPTQLQQPTSRRNRRYMSQDDEILVIIDEVQAGFGRTGTYFGFEHFLNALEVDIICCGKGISSSLPLSAVIANKKLFEGNMSFNSTHGGNPVALAAANASLEELRTHGFLSNVQKKGLFLENLLLEWQKEMPEYVKQVYCKGLLASVFIEPGNINISKEEFVDRLIEIAMQKGLLSIRTGAGTLKIGPPLTIPTDAIKEGVEILKESLLELIAQFKKEQGTVENLRHVGINVKNLETSLKFYTDILGFEVKQNYADDSDYVNKISGLSGARLKMAKLYSKAYQTGIELVEYELKEQSLFPETPSRSVYQTGGLHFALQVSNAKLMYQKIKDFGLQTISEPVKSPEGATVFFCYDPDGARIEIVEIAKNNG